jgi:putative ABC transport system permease protein
VQPTEFAYRLLLFAFPARVRREFGDDMAAMFAKQIAEVRARRESIVRLWVRAAADAAVHGFAERLRASDRPRAHVARGAGAKPSGSKWRSLMRAFHQDVRYALRMLSRQPGVTFLVVIMLALGIGANAAIFSAVNAILLRPLPYEDPDRLVMLWEKRPAEGVMNNVVSPADFVDWTAQATSFERMAAMTSLPADLTGVGDPVRLRAGAVSPSFFDLLGVRPLLGRTFREDEGTVGQHRVVILSHHLWTSQFGRDPSVVGRRLLLNGISHEVVGVLPATFESPDEMLDLWAPLPYREVTTPLARANHELLVFARMKDGVTIHQARADMDRVGSKLEQLYPQTNRGHGGWAEPLDERLRTPVRSSLLLLLGAVAFVLLIACVNVANILLANAAGRRREMAVRAAVGAGRARLAGQMLTESLLLALLGGLAGLVVAWWGIGLLRQLAPGGVPLVGLPHLGLDARVVAFAAGLSLLTGVLFGFLPAWHLAGQDVNASLKDGGRSPAGVRRRLRVALVISEIALASLLLVAAGLTLRSFQSVLDLEPGFTREGVLAAGVALPAARYPDNPTRLSAFDRLEEELRGLPGVTAVGGTSHLPLSGRDSRRGVGIEGRTPVPDAPTRAHPRSITPGYFQAMGITLREGRAFTAADTATAPRVAIVNDTMARRYWPGASPVGKRIRLSGIDEWIAVVGVIADVKHWGLERAVNPEMYFPETQYVSSSLTFVVRTAGDPAALAGSVRERVRTIDADLPVSGIRTMEDVAAVSVAARRGGMLLLAVFGALALVLAGAGIHGVMSHLVALRTSEMGIRATLGASPGSIMGLVLREGAVQALAGLAIGLTGGVLLMRTFQTVLFGVAPADPVTLIAVSGGLFATAIAACAVPARRAMRVDPVTALRGSV